MTSKKTAFTAHIGRARTRIQQRARIQLKPCPLSDTILLYRTSVLFPLDGFGSVVPSFQLHPVFGIDTEYVPPNDAMSRFVGFGDKIWDNLKYFFQTQGFEFLFLSQRAQRGALGGSIALKTPLLKLDRSLARKPPAAIVSELTRAACRLICKTPGRRSSPSAGKVSSLRWLAYELTSGLWDSADIRKRFEPPEFLEPEKYPMGALLRRR